MTADEKEQVVKNKEYIEEARTTDAKKTTRF